MLTLSVVQIPLDDEDVLDAATAADTMCYSQYDEKSKSCPIDDDYDKTTGDDDKTDELPGIEPPPAAAAVPQHTDKYDCDTHM